MEVSTCCPEDRSEYFSGIKRNRRDNESHDQNHAKSTITPSSSSSHSDYTLAPSPMLFQVEAVIAKENPSSSLSVIYFSRICVSILGCWLQ